MNKLYTIVFLLVASAINAQCLLQPISLPERVENSDLVFEGEVIARVPFEDEKTGRIFTKNTFKVYSIFKGETSKTTIDVITYGGQLGDRLEVANPNLNLQRGDVGVILLEKNNYFNAYSGVSGPSSFIKYNKINQRAVDAFEVFANEKALKDDLEYLAGNENQIQERSQIYYQRASNKRAGITSFTSTVTAGNQDVLTINGTGFGSLKGKVLFADANDGGASNIEAEDSAYFESWTDTKIEVYVPQRAGTGKINVVTSTSTSYVSSTDLTVAYSRLEVVANGPSTNPGTRLYSPVLDDDNTEGGYTWSLNTDFKKNSKAIKAIMRAMQSWRCSTGINFNVDTTTAVTNNTVARDGVHTIMWQNPDQLINVGSLGVTFSMWSGCYNSSTKDWHWYLNDVDMVFDDELSNNRTWNYGPGAATSAQYDMESVALHELGHAHQLGHIIDATGVMHYSIKNGEEKRKLNANIDVAAGDDVMKGSTVSTGCSSVEPMKKLTSNCAIIDVVDIMASFTSSQTKVCVGDTIVLTNTTEPTDANLQWRIPTGATVISQLSTDKIKFVEINESGVLNFGLMAEKQGFTDSMYQEVTSDKNPVALSKVDNVTCNGEANGEITLILGEGKAPFTIIWDDNGNTNNPRRNLIPATYTYTCLDATSCTSTGSIEVTEPDVLEISNSGAEATWGGLARGKAFVEATGGIQPYKYRWDDDANQKTDTASKLLAGEYNVRVIDANDCEESISVTVDELSSTGELRNNQVSFYPNPTSGQISFQVAMANRINVYSSTGKLLLSKKLVSADNNHELDLGKLVKGTYFVFIVTDNEMLHEVIIKE